MSEHERALNNRIENLERAYDKVVEADDRFVDPTTRRLLARIQDDIEKSKQVTSAELSIYNAEWNQAFQSAAKIRDAYFEIGEILEEADIIHDLSEQPLSPGIDPDEIDGGMLDLIEQLDTEINTWINVTETIEEECR